MITPNQQQTKTIIYSKNYCMQCTMTKKQLKDVEYEEVNIENSDQFDQYVEYIKNTLNMTALPVVVPPPASHLAAWSGFQPDKIKALIAYQEENS